MLAPKFRRKLGIKWKFNRPLGQMLGQAKGTNKSMNSAFRLLAVVVILAVAVVGGLIYLGQSTQPSVQNVEKVLPDGQFPR